MLLMPRALFARGQNLNHENMKRNQLWLSVLIPMAIFICQACQKNAGNVENQKKEIPQLSRITPWLENIATHSNGERKERIKSIESSMNLSAAEQETFDDKNLIVVPLKAGFTT